MKTPPLPQTYSRPGANGLYLFKPIEESKMIKFLPLLLSLLFSGCMADYELTWKADSNISLDDLKIIQKSIALWEDAVDVSFRQVNKNPVIVFEVAILEYPLMGMESAQSSTRFDAERQRVIPVLESSNIYIHPDVFQPDADEGLKLRILNHEIGHVFIRRHHTTDCPSTMHPIIDRCGTLEIDSQAAEMARENIADGWLSKRADPILDAVGVLLRALSLSRGQ